MTVDEGSDRGKPQPANGLTPEAIQAIREQNRAMRLAMGPEVSKMLMASSLEFIRNNTQLLNGLTAALLTTYFAVLAFAKDAFASAFLRLPGWLAFVPAIFFSASLITAVFQTLTYKADDYIVGDFDSAMMAYDRVIQVRRRHVTWPAVLTGLGIVAFGLVLVWLLTTNVSGVASPGMAPPLPNTPTPVQQRP